MGKLAICGGSSCLAPDAYKRFWPWPPVDEATADRMRDLYLSGCWSFNSAEEQAFETAFAASQDAAYGVFMVNGTVTLEAALAALGIGPGDEVIVPGLTWVATAQAIKYVGAKIVFADIDPATFALQPAAFEAAITPRTKAVIPVHLYRSMADLEQILAIARRHQLRVVEDCAHMQGGKWDGRGVGSWSDISSFSFQQSKVLSGGEGGICLTNDQELADRLYRFKHIGYSRYDKQGAAGTPPPPGLTCHNYRGQAFSALALSGQLPGLPGILERYDAFVKNISDGLRGVPGLRLQAPGRLATRQGCYGLGLVFDGQEWEGIGSARLASALAAEGFPAGPTYGPVYRHLLFNLDPADYRIADGVCQQSEFIHEHTLIITHWNMYFPEEGIRFAEGIRKLSENRNELR
jgi:dTDP-4-amino-4,6-dideoxygalactose transaminase